ncbi:MAG: exo-alpha-sialidase [Pirellulales bacterium]|nr:exo-alpha-sialidase [Pirellulales bacterium]
MTAIQLIAVFLAPCAFPGAVAVASADRRDIRAGSLIPDENYCDQPYIVITKDGDWLCVLTTGPGREGRKGQHIVSTISTDAGKTWSKLVDIEPSDGWKFSSWAVPLIVPDGRVYVFYLYNGDEIRSLPSGKPIPHPEVLGWYCHKYSDDGGRSWSADRHRLPLPVTACDRANDWGGAVQIFWGIDKPKIVGRSVFFAFTKMGRFMFENGEGWLFRSDNVLAESEPAKLHWSTLPDGEHGIRSPEFGSYQEEHNVVPLDGGGLYCAYRTATGHPCHCYGSDGGRAWTKPEHMTYAPGGRKIKNPRACPKLWRTADGRFLFWFHNHGGRDHQARNPAWITGGVEKDGAVHWAQPEILLYDRDARVQGMSYPDLIEQDGRYWVTETNKTEARVHEIDKTLLEGLWNQRSNKTVAREGLLLEAIPDGGGGRELNFPRAVVLGQSGGLTLDCWIRLKDLEPGRVLIDGRDADGRGTILSTIAGGAVRLTLGDGKTTASWDSDPGLLDANKPHHVVAIADAGPQIITFVIDGELCDGGESRKQGWGRWKGALGKVLHAGRLTLDPAIISLRVYDRYLRTSEAIGNFRCGSPKPREAEEIINDARNVY